MISNRPLPSTSIVIEWDNARLSALARARAMLETLRRQIETLRPRFPAPPEILLLYDRHEIDPAGIEAALDAAFADAADLARRRIVGVEGLRYYALKNEGASMSSGEVVVFIDSDVIPDEGWLETLLESFEDPAVEIVGGQTYMPRRSLYSKAFALFWFFGVRADREDMAEEPWFFANNFAVRRETFARFPFPPAPLYRGNCVHLAETLRRNGVRIFRNYRAAVEHPPPGLAKLATRALWEGHDHVMTLSAYRPCTWRTIAGLHLRSLRDMLVRARRDSRAAGITLIQVPAALALGLVYWSLKLTGAVLTQIRPGLLSRYLKA